MNLVSAGVIVQRFGREDRMDAKRIVRSSRLTIWAAVAIAAMLGERVVAQGVVMERNLSLAMAKTSAEAALAECMSKGYHTSKPGSATLRTS
jgi:hypothetical protein